MENNKMTQGDYIIATFVIFFLFLAIMQSFEIFCFWSFIFAIGLYAGYSKSNLAKRIREVMNNKKEQ